MTLPKRCKRKHGRGQTGQFGRAFTRRVETATLVFISRKPFPSKTGKVFFLSASYRYASEKGVGAMSDSVPMTRAGYNKIKAEIDRMENVEMPAVTEKIAEARAEGDLKENAEYHAQRENQGMLMAKIGELKNKIARASIIDVSKLPKDEVVFGCTVTVEDIADSEEEEFTFVGAGEEDIHSGKILVTSPVGQGLIGKKVGETAEVEVPVGQLKFKILKIEFRD
jgi:transcription elongation factor GreA